MKLFTLCLLSLPAATLFSEQTIFQPAMLASSYQMQEMMADSVPEFDLKKAMNYLESLHSYLKSLGGENLYTVLKGKSEEELSEISTHLSDLLAPISENIEPRPRWCGGLGSIGLVGLFLTLDDLLTAITAMKEEKSISAKIFSFFKYLGCKDTILWLFL